MLKRLLAKASPILGSRSDWLGLCLLCRQPCDDQPLLCSWCQQSLHQPCRKCRLCAAPLPEHHEGNEPLCGRCQRRPPPWERLQVIGDYQLPYSLLIPRLKYSGQILLAPLLARLLADHLEETIPRGHHSGPPALVAPVVARLQSGGRDWTGPWRDHRYSLRHPAAAQDQGHSTTNPAQCRPAAAEPARRLPDSAHSYRHVALLDDVVTTGATAGQLSRLLRKSGVEKVEVWALCRTQRHIK